MSIVANIQELVKDKWDLVREYENDIILAIGVILISLFSFAVGYITAKEQLKEPIRIQYNTHEAEQINK